MDKTQTVAGKNAGSQDLDRRRRHRVPIRGTAKISDERGTRRVHVADLCVVGLGLQGAELAVGEDVSLMLTNGDRVVSEADGVVAWSSGNRLGVDLESGPISAVVDRDPNQRELDRAFERGIRQFEIEALECAFFLATVASKEAVPGHRFVNEPTPTPTIAASSATLRWGLSMT